MNEDKIILKNDRQRSNETAIKMKVATWNVRSMYETGKIHNAIKEMKRMQIDILGVSEMRWPGTGECNIDGYQVYYAGNDEAHHYNGVAFILAKNIAKSVKSVTPISDRVIILQLNSKPFNTNIIQVYAPTSTSSEEDLEKFYKHLDDALTLSKSSDNTIVMGDFNAKVGKGRCHNNVGDYGLGNRNERGDRLVQFCQEYDFGITNTYFKLPLRRLYTWKSNAETEDKIVRNQVDYILITHRFRNGMKSVKTYPGADIGSDHNPVVAVIHVRLKKINKKLFINKIDRAQLKNKTIREEVRKELHECLNNQELIGNDVEKDWSTIKTSISKISRENLKGKPQTTKKSWMTNEIIDLMEQRRAAKNNKNLYKELQKTVRQKIRQAKAQKLTEQCTEIEELEAKYDAFNMYKKIKEAAGINNKRKAGQLHNDQGKAIPDLEGKLVEWVKYISDLFNDIRADETPVITTLEGPLITCDEVEHAIKLAKTGKAIGPDEIPCEIYKLIEDRKAMQVLTELFNAIYASGHIPSDWAKSVFITLPKKATAKTCGDYRTISLMSHLLKIFLKVIHGRIYHKCEEYLSESQFGFRNGFGTREALFGLSVLAQRCRDMSVDLYACFIDFQKAFDRVKHDVLIEILKDIGLDGKDVRIIANLYWNQTAVVRVDNTNSESVNIKRGVRQGCILSPLLFNVYSERIFREAISERMEGIIVNGEVINNLRYADDTVLLASNEEDLQCLLDRVTAKCAVAGLDLNIKKTKVLVISKQHDTTANVTVRGVRLEQVRQIKYLGCLINNDGDNHTEIRSRIECARAAFNKMRKVLCSRDLRLPLRIRLLRCYVFSILLYGVEAWTINSNEMRRLEAFEMWCYRRILKISWIDKVRNLDILKHLNKNTEILCTIKRRKLEYFGHVMRGAKYRLLQNIMQGKIAGKRGSGRRKTSWLKNLRDWCGVNSSTLFRIAVNKIQIAVMVTKVLGGHGT